jgi:2-(3-amino-3-carboxypropyl)histidine synthase
MEYYLELEKATQHIKSKNAKIACIQLPDGLKEKAKEISDYLEKKTKAKIVVWLGSCYGACDVPLQIEKLGIDLLIQWGHSEWKY